MAPASAETFNDKLSGEVRLMLTRKVFAFGFWALQSRSGLVVRPLQNVEQVVTEEPRDDHAHEDREYRNDQPVPQFPQMLEESHLPVG